MTLRCALCVAAALAACAPRRLLVVRPTESTRVAAGAAIGVARVELTPPLGTVLGGHGPNGLFANGYRGRLECSALYLADAQGESFLWLACDLAFAPSLLQRRIAERLRATATEPRCAALGSDRLALSASHTHAGPGNVPDALAYSQPTPRADGFTPLHPGLDVQLLELLTERGARAALDACIDAARPGAPELRWSHAEQRGFTTNQSLEAFCANEGAACGQAPDPRAHVPGGLDVLQVLRGGATAAVLFFYGIHPTAVPNGNDVFHADLVEAARLRIRQGWRQGPLEPGAVVLFVNGAEGDVGTYSQVPPGFRRAREVGRTLGDAVLRAVEQPGATQAVKLQRSARDVALAGGQPLTGPERALPCGAEGSSLEGPADLCPLGWTGAAAGGGSEDGPTVYRQFPFELHEGLRSERGGCQAPKRPLVLGLFDESGPCMYPEVAPVLWLQLGSRQVVTLPFEPTATAAARIGRGAIVASLTNGYAQYVATAEEYALQQYEGASTLYGPNQERFLGAQVARLAHEPGVAQRAWNIELELKAEPPAAQRFERPEHAVLPEPEPCAPLEVPVPAAALERLAVRVTDAGGVGRLNSLGVEISERVQDVEVRLTERGAVARWHPERCPAEGEVACLEAGGARRCAAFTHGVWAQSTSATQRPP